ncbi:hypothetical protein PYCCODRAFT_1394003 [Trametes coccinea BRFM310]|uniref:Uncharacterized protein n=1 Tax=Trametes coccinea (strain BRFM310) TaxID=1353009 RepID=A0A1Y2IG34_TRAC3|nr:hypothetical protein PYCCODRAFT_1394003 [Trametes coccinea BRFM310]
MPELDILHGFEHLTLRLKSDWIKHHWGPFKAQWMIFPRAFAVGTKQKDYVTCTVDERSVFDYKEQLEPVPEGYQPNLHDIGKARGKEFARYLKPLADGELAVKARGKEIIFAAGYHAMRIHFGLEGTMSIIPTEAFHKMINNDCPGSNKDKKKASLMRSFIVPDELIVQGARTPDTARRTMAIFAALVGEEHTLIMVDHNRLLRIHIMSLSKPWTQEQLEPDSKLWPHIWSDNHGPDWIHELKAAEACLDAWRADVLAAAQTFKSPALLDAICSTQEVFNGYGQHTAHELLHELGLWPGMPVAELCCDEDTYSAFKQELHLYAEQYTSSTYRERCLSLPNQDSPLVYNYKSDDNYHKHYLRVFRKASVRVPRALFNRLAKAGLFNPAHTIGEPYQYSEEELIAVEYRDIPVYQYTAFSSSKDPIYSVIVARRPPSWKYSGDNVRQIIAPDARNAGFSTTIGPASFHLYKNNQYNWNLQGEPGRKPKVHTGKAGRPPRAKPLVATLRGRATLGSNALARATQARETMSVRVKDGADTRERDIQENRPTKRIRLARASMVGESSRVTRSQGERQKAPL